MNRNELSASMTVTDFDNGYWFVTDLKRFAKELGIPLANRLRKDELERAIKAFLRSGTIMKDADRAISAPKERDVDRGLRLDLRVVGYINDVETKQFLEREARRIVPGLKRRSGAMYRLNRWREAQILNGATITYRDLVKEYVRLNVATERFARVPHGRYINFMSDFLSREPNATREGALKAWAALKTMSVPKTYKAWVRAGKKRASR